MAAPTFIQAGSGATDAGGDWFPNNYITATAGNNLIVLHVLQDGSTANAVTLAAAGSGNNIKNLAGTADQFDYIGKFAVGNPTAAYQHIWIARSVAAGLITFGDGANTTSEDLYWRVYEFGNVSTGTTLATVIENSTAGNATNGVGTSNTASDTAVTTLGPDRLALNFVGVNDDNAISAFTGETGGDWTLAVAPYADSGGTDGAIGLQAAYPVASNISYLAGTFGAAVYGATGIQEQRATSFDLPGGVGIAQVTVGLRKYASPVDTVIIEIQADSGGLPSGTAIATSSAYSSASLTTTVTDIPFALPISSDSLPAGKYWIVCRRTGAHDETNYIGFGLNTTDVYANNDNAYRSSGTWSAAGTGIDARFAVYLTGATTIDGGTGSIVDSDAWGVVGFALIGTTPTPPTSRQPRNPAINFQDPALV